MPLREESFGDRLYDARLDRELTQQQVSDETGIPAAAISHYECGRREPNLKNLALLCDALNVSANKLLGLWSS